MRDVDSVGYQPLTILPGIFASIDELEIEFFIKRVHVSYLHSGKSVSKYHPFQSKNLVESKLPK